MDWIVEQWALLDGMLFHEVHRFPDLPTATARAAVWNRGVLDAGGTACCHVGQRLSEAPVVFESAEDDERLGG